MDFGWQTLSRQVGDRKTTMTLPTTVLESRRKRTVFGRRKIVVNSLTWVIEMRADAIVMRARYGRKEFKVPLATIVEEYALRQKLLL